MSSRSTTSKLSKIKEDLQVDDERVQDSVHATLAHLLNPDACDTEECEHMREQIAEFEYTPTTDDDDGDDDGEDTAADGETEGSEEGDGADADDGEADVEGEAAESEGEADDYSIFG